MYLVREVGKGRWNLGNRAGNNTGNRVERRIYKWPRLLILALYIIKYKNS